MTELEKILYRNLYKRSFYEFVKAFWETADPSKFVDGKLIQYYCEIFQYMCRGWIGYEEIKIKIPKIKKDEVIIDVRKDKHNININMPPRHSKSMIFNVLGPVWIWVNNPIKAVSISHTGELAKKMNMKRQSVINSEKFKLFFPEIRMTSNTADSIIDNRGGELYSQNRNAMTGYGGDIIINDDLTNAEAARKDKEEMNNAWNYYQNTMPSRINNINSCIIMNIQQRLAPNDITGHIMNDEKLSSEYIFVTLPAIFNETTYIVFPISGEVIKFKKGDPLWPERFDNYEAIKNQVGLNVFETQYLQKAISSDKTVIKKDMIEFVNENEVLGVESADMIYASHDFPVKEKEKSDFLGSVLAYRIGSTLYIKDCLEKRMAFVKSVNYVEQLYDIYPGIIQVIEDKANGSPILQQLQENVPGMQAYQPGSKSKTDRLDYCTPYLTAHNIKFIKSNYDKFTNTWKLSESLENLVKRLLNFPFVEHDDIVDAFSMLVLFVFMDKRYMVYGRSFNDSNIVDISLIKGLSNSVILFNREGDVWKVVETAVKYGRETSIYVIREKQFRADIEEGINKMKEFAPKKTVFIDCSKVNGLYGLGKKGVSILRYEIEEFDRSVSQLELAFSKNRVLIDKNCKLIKTDIESFKFTKAKDDTVKYVTEKDGFVACLRTAMKYYGGIN